MRTSYEAPVRRRHARLLVAATTALLTAGLLVLPACSSTAEAATFQREPVETPTADPFMQSVGTDDAGVTTPENITAGAYSAKIPGLYGGSSDNAACDPAELVAFLEANPDKAKAWAGVLGIDPADIESYVAKLTPVILRTDTAVTNHGFENGDATSIPAVLQAGTAVLVDDHGVPVVKCGCGNPLTAPPSTEDASFTGTTWTGFTPEAVTTIEATDEPVARLVIADPSGTGIVRPTGTTGADDTPFDPTTVTPDGEPTATTPGGGGTTTGVDDPNVTTPPPAATPGGDGTVTDVDDPSVLTPAEPATPAPPTGPGITLTGNAVPAGDCDVVAPTPTTVQVHGSGSNRTISLPSAAAGGFTGLVFAVNPDGSIDSEVTYEPPGAPGFVVTYRFQGQLSIQDPPTPTTLTGALSVTVSGGGTYCTIQYDATGQDLPDSEGSTTTTAPGETTTTYIARFGPGISPIVSATSNGCDRSQLINEPWAVTIQVRDERNAQRVTVEGGGHGSGSIAMFNPRPTEDATGPVSEGGFRVGGSRRYDDFWTGDFTAYWSGDVGSARTRPAEFQLRIYHNWDRQQGFLQWLGSSGGPDDYNCSIEVTAVRQP